MRNNFIPSYFRSDLLASTDDHLDIGGNSSVATLSESLLSTTEVQSKPVLLSSRQPPTDTGSQGSSTSLEVEEIPQPSITENNEGCFRDGIPKQV